MGQLMRASGAFEVTMAATNGNDGAKGAKPVMLYWDECASGFQFKAGVGGEDVYHIVWETRNLTAGKATAYLCIATHTKSSTKPSADSTHWQRMSNLAMIATDLMLTRQILASEINAENLVVTNGTFEGKLLLKFHTFSSNTGNFYLNPNIGIAFMNGASSKYSQSLYKLPPPSGYKGLVIRILIYYIGLSGHGSSYVVSEEGFTYIGSTSEGQYVLCNKTTINPGRIYEFISIGSYWCCNDGDSYSLDQDLDFSQTFEDPID